MPATTAAASGGWSRDLSTAMFATVLDTRASPKHRTIRAALSGTSLALAAAMAHPRRVVAGETYLVTRRCSRRTFRLHPCAETRRIFLYCLAFAAERTGVVLHAACVMSDHHHLVLTDVRGVLPVFLRELHRLTAKAINASQGQWENLWAAEPCNAVRLVTDADVQEKIAYVVANPVAAGLVEQPEQWPGVLLWGETSMRVRRPRSYFRESGACAEELELRFERPAVREGRTLSPSDWRERVGRAIAEKVASARRATRALVGRAAPLASSISRRARTYEARFGIIPTFAARERSVREWLKRVEQAFRRHYRRAYERWRRGELGVVFPAGTWGMTARPGATVASR